MFDTIFFSPLLSASDALGHGAHSGLSEFLFSTFGEFGHFLDEVVLHALIDTLKLVPFLFLTYLLMEFVEHTLSDKARAVMKKTGALGPAVGGALGAVPQCGFSAVAANLYTGRVVTLGTLIAVFLSTSDEMLPILLAGGVAADKVLSIIVYKILVGILVGFIIDFILRLCYRGETHTHIEGMCEEEGCHCERGIVRSALHHTLTVGLFILATTFLINVAIFLIGEERITSIIVPTPLISHFISALIGLIPNCATSVALTKFALSGFITSGTMLSGLFSGAGVGLLVLFRVNRRPKENALIIAILLAAGTVFGAVADLFPLFAL